MRALFVYAATLPTVIAADDGHPAVTGSLPFFYYNDLPAAADWYRNKLGLKPLTEEDWVVIFELNDSSYIGLVKAGSGLLKPTEDKGAIFSIDTPELEAWWDRLKDMEGINIKNGIRTGADGMNRVIQRVRSGTLHRRVLPLERTPPGGATLLGIMCPRIYYENLRYLPTVQQNHGFEWLASIQPDA